MAKFENVIQTLIDTNNKLINGEIDINLKNLRSGNVFNFLRWKYGTKPYDASADRERRLGYINNMGYTNSITFSGYDNK